MSPALGSSRLPSFCRTWMHWTIAGRSGSSIGRASRPRRRWRGCRATGARERRGNAVARVEIHADRIAELEADGWRAYYHPAAPRVISLMVALNQEQFHIPFPLSVVAALHIARASVAWVPVDHDEAAVTLQLRRFYRMARRWSGLAFDPRRAADLEIGYWIEHRRL